MNAASATTDASGPGAGRVVLVTGATSGLGLAIAETFARQGACVMLAGRRQERGEVAAAAIRAAGGEAAFVAADVTRPDEVDRMVAAVVTRYGGLDVAINNAGIGGAGARRLADYPEADWHAVLATNLTGVFLCMKREIPELLQRPGASIVNIASVAGQSAGPVGCAYTASKHGVIGLTRSAAVEYAARGLRINAVAPGVVRTEINDSAFFSDPAITARIVALHPLGRVGTPADVAAAVLWLASPAAAFVTGITLPVDGGYLAR